MSNDELDRLASGYIEHFSSPVVRDKGNVFSKRDTSTTDWVSDSVFDITYENPEQLWELILEILQRNPPVEVIEVLAAGPLEDYLSKLGEKVIEKVERQAAIDVKFRSLLGGVWKNAMSDDVWERVQACWDRSEWNNGA